MELERPLRVGISACLLGDEVRFDGGHKRDRFLTDILGRYVEWIRVCPEVELGLGTPRETLRLVQDARGVRMITTGTGVDHTDGMNAFSLRRVEELADQNLCGYVLKKDSPSCGMERVKVYRNGDRHLFLGNGLKNVAVPISAERSGRGFFAEVLLRRLPTLPVEEEGRLSDPRLRENFIERIFAYRRLKELLNGRPTTGDLVRFHTAHKMSLLSHSTTAYQQLGRLVARASDVPAKALHDQYEASFMKALALIATPRRHTNVLMHIAGHLKKLLDPASKRELLECIDEYRRELVPLIVPLTLLRHYVRLHDVEYLANQTYLEPHPRELMLRNHV
ncbi:MAG: DUF523 and DUF1722 domain-containing protein [Acidobacteria bacterium]|nr:DUF523 and DUF1722 domain-containing protein [Acidobacteriota bacterium]